MSKNTLAGGKTHPKILSLPLPLKSTKSCLPFLSPPSVMNMHTLFLFTLPE